ncbi:MAG: hypothetical protein DRH17_09105 [Deltaproteobacteria bacterium]|nr:MAG: hypothetical protein DRH17_09105 [Deltaproteobacteria bacterium]
MASKKLIGILLLALIIAPILPATTLTTTAQAQTTTTDQGLPSVALVKLWEVSHDTYMAKFVGEDYIVIFDRHGDVSLNGRYIAAFRAGGHAWIYKVSTGELIATLSADSDDDYGDTWEVISWEPFQATKVWDKSGFFSADSNRMVEDPRVGGTEARVVSTGSWVTIPIEWGFTDTNGNHFYAIQLDYSGSTLAVGYIGQEQTADESKLLVYKYDPAQGKYVKVFEHSETGDYGRRLQMTLDGKYIVVGGLLYPYLDIWEYDEASGTYVRVVHYELPDPDGLGALGISDPYKVGYIIAGTYNGWVGIYHFDPETKEFKVLYETQHAGDQAWFYNPFYERWIPKVTEVFALASKAGVGVVYDVLTGKAIEINYGGSYGTWKAAAVSPEANYVFVGNALYMVVKRDVQARQPRVRFWGSITFQREYQDLATPLTLTAPARDWHLYFFNGRLTIKRIYVEPIPVDLVEDPDVKFGRLAKMYDKGLISTRTFYTENAEVTETDIVPGTEVDDILYEEGIENPENFIAAVSLTHFTPPPYFWEGHAWTGTVIRIPLDKPINVYDDIMLQLSTSIHTSSLAYDKNKRALAVLGIPVEIGGGVGIGATAYSKIANRILIWYASKHAVSVGKAAAVATSQSVAKVAGIVGIAVAIWGGIDAALVEWGGLGDVNIQNWIVIAPVVEDSLGNKYTAIQLILPLEESDNVEKYYDIFSNYFRELGYLDVGFRVTYPCRTWDEYKTLLAAGYSPQVKLDDLIEETIAAKYGLDINELKIKGVDVIVVTAVRAKETFWEWLFGLGGVDFDTVTLVGAATITVKGKLKAGTITDPSEIAALLGKVTINGIEFKLTPGVEGAYTDFSFNLGASELVIDFGKRTGYFADLVIDATVMVKKEFEPLEDFGYTATLHYDWQDTLIRISRIEFTDMPYPMLKAERIFVYKYGNFTNDITDAFELSKVIDDPESPSGKLYYYITEENTLYIDPANGGMMQPCKTYIFNYYYKEPPDVGIMVFLNGTRVTSTLAHHATVVLNSSAEQDVEYSLTINVKYFEGLEEKTLMSEKLTDMVHIPANGTAYKIYDITSYVDAAIEFMRSQNKTAFVEIIAKIVNAPKNYYKGNDEYRVVYYPPPLLPPPVPPGVYNVTVKVFEYVLENSSWIPTANATVEVYYGTTTESEIHYTAITDEKGEANFTLEAGTWTFKAYKEGFTEAILTAPIYNDTVIQLYLAPVPQPPAENRTYVEENVTVTFNVYDATNGSAIPNANITLVFIEPTNSSYYGMTFSTITDSSGKAVIEIPIGFYNVTVNATGYRLFKAQYLFDKDTIVNIALVPETIDITQYAKLEVRVYYADGKPYTGAHVEIYNATDGSLIAMLATNSYGNATVLLPINQDYNVTVKVEEPLYNRSYVDSKIITLTQDTIVTFVVPWESPQPPTIINGTPYYWLTVQVVWANGLPFHGARVSVYNYTSGELIDSMVTNGTGTVHFLLPAFQNYVVWVNAVNPYNTSQTYDRIFILNLTDNRWITVELPWLPEEISEKYRVLVYAYDVVTGEGVPDVTVILRKGDVAWAAETNETGYAELWIPFQGLFNITGIHPDYDVIWRNVQIYENNTLINLPMSPVIIPPELYPPLNGTYPPIYINGTPHYWLSVQVLWNDGYPFHGANVTVYDLGTGEVIATGVTNGTGFVHFLIPANLSIKYTVKAYNPELNETYYAERTLNMTQHYYFVHVLPWVSKYYSPEVWLKELHFIIHRGQGYYFGNVSHLVLLTIWTNKPQTVTVLIGLYNVTGDTWVQNKTVTLTLEEGVNTFFEWVTVNATSGGRFKVFANITQYEYDTDPTNNWLWSEEQFLKPQVDIEVFVLWRPIEQKQPWTLLPEDVIEIDIGIRLPINTSAIPARLEWRVEKYDLKNLVYEIERGAEEEIRVVQPGIIWRNVTVVVPWTSKIVVLANVTHEWEDFGYNNFVNVTIEIDPDVKIELVDVPSTVMEGSIFKVTVNITSNVEPGKGIGWVSIVDNTTATLLKRVEIELAPQKTLEIEAKAPENPTTFWIFRAPTTVHHITAQFAGYDLYTENNKDEFTLTVISYQWLTIIAIIVIIIAVLAAFRALTHTIHDIREKSRKFVKRKSFLTESIWDHVEGEKERRFVRKKKD